MPELWQEAGRDCSKFLHCPCEGTRYLSCFHMPFVFAYLESRTLAPCLGLRGSPAASFLVHHLVSCKHLVENYSKYMCCRTLVRVDVEGSWSFFNPRKQNNTLTPLQTARWGEWAAAKTCPAALSEPGLDVLLAYTASFDLYCTGCGVKDFISQAPLQIRRTEGCQLSPCVLGWNFGDPFFLGYLKEVSLFIHYLWVAEPFKQDLLHVPAKLCLSC